MNESDYNFENVCRTALILRPKQPFVDWINKCELSNNFTLSDLSTDVFLLPDFDEEIEMDEWLEHNYDRLFCHQMNSWYVDSSYWPKIRTFKIFKEWFTYSFHTMLWDTEQDNIDKL